MLPIIHRVNTVDELKNIPREYGVEVDIRTFNNQLILNHEPFENGDVLDTYLSAFNHAFIILEIKEEGIERAVIELCKKHRIENYFLLSVSFPFIRLLSEEGMRKIAVRFSEFEDANTALALALQGKVDWVWVDTFTKNPLTKEVYRQFTAAGYHLCLVCPERWGRPQDIETYKLFFKEEGIVLDAVMTSLRYAEAWKK